jgi:hydroxypyruvate isomerase
MPRFAANISMLYPEHPLLERIGASARDGFAAVEVQAPYAATADDFARSLREARVELVLMNAPAGNADAGERGLASLPGQEARFDAALDEAVDYARIVVAPRVHVMAGVPPRDAPAEDCRRVFMRNVGEACRRFAPYGITIMLEPINTRDFPGYFLNYQQQAVDLIAAIGAPNLRLQMDFYHLQVMEGDLIRHLERHFASVGHVQVAGVPERFEPDVGEIHHPALFARLDALGYRGWVGCEYRPARGAAPGGTSAGLGWMRRP